MIKRKVESYPPGPSRLGGFLSSTVTLLAVLLAAHPASSQTTPDWTSLEAETLAHFQALIRIDTSSPPGNETAAVEYLRGVLEREGVSVEVFALEPSRANLVARLEGSGAKRPLLLMGHTDVVTVDPAKWTHPPFGAVRAGGYIYGRGTLDDKDNVVASLMVMLLLKRLDVPLDRDVIFLAESGEEGTTRPGIDFMVEQHFPAIDAEYCLAEGGGVVREDGQVTFATVGALEKIPRTVVLTARGPSGHGSVPLATNAIARLARAITAVSAWQPPIRLNETTREYFGRLAAMSGPEDAARFRALLGSDRAQMEEAAEYFQQHQPAFAAMLRTSVSPTIVEGGFRRNVIPSEATATLDVRLLPDENPDQVLDLVRGIVDDASVEVSFAPRDGAERPAGGSSLDTEAFRAIEAAVAAHYDAVTLPVMSTGASDKAQVRAKGVQCYGIGPAVDVEDGPRGFGAHSDQERILEAELHRFVRFNWDVVLALAGKR